MCPQFHAFVFVALLCALVLPAAAAAETYTVDSTLDEPDAAPGTAGCLTAGLKCTLRAAIQESNFSTGTKDTITFTTAFNGELADTIAIGASFPAIDDPVMIDGDQQADELGQCEPLTGILGPCVGVEKSGGGFGLVVEANEVTIEGLAVTGALTGINVINESENFVAHDNWVGLKLDGTAGANNTGIFLDPNSDNATIGGVEAADRNVIADNNNEGLDIEGASGATVRGNYFGVTPGGATQAANAKDIEVTNSTAGGGFEAIGNEIGGGVTSLQAASAACDGGCNVISGSLNAGIDMQGVGANEAAPSGPTTIQGNYLGLNAGGTAAVPNSASGVLVGGADRVLIGGSGEGGANHFNGGEFGVLAGAGLTNAAKELVIDGNLIGVNSAASATLSPPSTNGIFVSSEGVTSAADAAEITDNLISMLGGVPIEQHSVGALISGNRIGRGANGESLSGGNSGIRLWGESGSGNIVESNVIENALGNGILIENDNNELVGNVIEGAELAGIRIQDFLTLASTGNAIGGDTEAEENAISESGGDAIEVAGEEDDDTQIRRNQGDGNAGLFIDLGADGPGNKLTGPNDGIQAPAISTATVSGASGAGARPGATVRVFKKATASPGELQSLIGKATADGGGNWSLTYASQIPGGTNIAATQSDIEGTSELGFALTATPPASGGGTGGDTKEKDKKEKSKKAAKDKTAPQTTIVKKKIKGRTAKFKFVSSEAGSTFQCRLDKKKFKPCRSPKKYKRLKPGKHVFEVRAIDAAGNKDKTPAKRRFRVLR